MSADFIVSVLIASSLFQLYSATGTISVLKLRLEALTDPPVAIGGGNCDEPPTVCQPFLKICISTTAFEMCKGTQYFTQIYNTFPIIFGDQILQGFQLKSVEIDKLTVGVFAYDKDGINLPQLSDNTPLVNLTLTTMPARPSIAVTQPVGSYRFEYIIVVDCDSNFYGSKCEVMCVPADSDTEGHYTCSDSADVFDCLPGYENPTGIPPCSDLIDQCSINPCSNGGSCSQPGPGQFSCDCDGTGFSGPTCNIAIDACAAAISPCVNVGNCNQGPLGTFSCDCPRGFQGERCERIVNPCDRLPCNNGDCLQISPDEFVCNCPPGYTGFTCETDINECDFSQCLNGGTCIQTEPLGFMCTCSPVYTGQTCNTILDSCISSPCENGGTCTRTTTSAFLCACVVGYTGVSCETDIDECAGSPCQNGGKCTNSLGGFVCCCPDNFSGPLCTAVHIKYNLRDITRNWIHTLRRELTRYCPDIKFSRLFTVHVTDVEQDKCFQWISGRYGRFGSSRPQSPILVKKPKPTLKPTRVPISRPLPRRPTEGRN